jgi:hypothetical protein
MFKQLPLTTKKTITIKFTENVRVQIRLCSCQ